MQAVSAVRSNKKADRNSAAEVRDVDHEIGFGFVTAAAVAVDEEEIMVREITGIRMKQAGFVRAYDAVDRSG